MYDRKADADCISCAASGHPFMDLCSNTSCSLGRPEPNFNAREEHHVTFRLPLYRAPDYTLVCLAVFILGIWKEGKLMS